MKINPSLGELVRKIMLMTDSNYGYVSKLQP